MNRFTSLPMKALQGADGTFPGQALALSLARSLAQTYATLPALSISPISLLTTATATTTTNVSFVTKPQQQLPPASTNILPPGLLSFAYQWRKRM